MILTTSQVQWTIGCKGDKRWAWIFFWQFGTVTRLTYRFLDCWKIGIRMRLAWSQKLLFQWRIAKYRRLTHKHIQ